MAAIETAELRALIDKMLIDSEKECVEFKEAKNDYRFEDLGMYFSALGNEANLRLMQYSWLLLGIDDKKKIVGTSYKNSRKSLDGLKMAVRQHTSDALTFIEIYEIIYEDGKRVVALQIPAAGRTPIMWKGVAYGREGSSLVNLTDHKAEKIRENGSKDWSERICVKATFDDLDKKAIAEMRRILKFIIKTDRPLMIWSQ